MMGDHFSDLSIEGIAIKHDDVPAAEALDFHVGPDPDNLKAFGMGSARMRLLHFHFVIESDLRRSYHGFSSILTAVGIFGRPGIVMILPVSGMMKFAPAERFTSRIVMVKPRGAPRTSGSSVSDCGVLAMQ